ncbi:unnamed protein product, partial [Leptidea sinapis]
MSTSQRQSRKSRASAAELESTSELNLITALPSVPIRTTRTSRLRAAAASNSNKKKSNRSSSVQLLLEDDTSKSGKNAKIIDRDKTKQSNNRRQSCEKENISVSPTFLDNDIGAIKTKHSISKNILEKDKEKCSVLISSPKGKAIDSKYNSKIDATFRRNLVAETSVVNWKDETNVDEVFNGLLDKTSSLDKEEFDVLFKDIVESKEVDVVNGDGPVLRDSELKFSNNVDIPIINKEFNDISCVQICNGDVPKVNEVGLLGAVCVRKVERFSELLSNLCSPREADDLFEHLLTENEIHSSSNLRAKAPECTPPCRRAQLPWTTTPAKRVPESAPVINGDVIKVNDSQADDSCESEVNDLWKQ